MEIFPGFLFHTSDNVYAYAKFRQRHETIYTLLGDAAIKALERKAYSTYYIC